MTAIVVLGMHRSGTSCLAGMLAAANVASAGPAIRNWDNARGHHERLELVRLDEAVLAHSGGNYLAAPVEVRWTAEHAAARDALLGEDAPLLKDPRMLLVLPCWRASAIPWRAIGIVRHPLAVARSLAAWREVPLVEGVALWLAHNRALAADRAAHGTPVLDFDRPKAHVVAELAALVGADPAVLATGYVDELVHHDDSDPPAIAGLDEAIALYRELGGQGGSRGTFPRAEYEAFERLLAAGSIEAALTAARAALANSADPAAVLVPGLAALIRARAWVACRALIAETPPTSDGLVDLLFGKLLLAVRDPVTARPFLEAACAVPDPHYQALALLPQALRSSGDKAAARAALERVVAVALYPHGPLSTLAEWSFVDGDHPAAIAGMARAIAAAPLHRRGRLRCRRAEWLRDAGDRATARAELELALVEDPTYRRTHDLLATLAR